jgi:hypothetical protein
MPRDQKWARLRDCATCPFDTPAQFVVQLVTVVQT